MTQLYRIISLIALTPLFFHVFTFCPFRMPYLYCYICPVRCIWYRIRGLVWLIALSANINNNLFCSYVCPFGTIQTLLFKLSRRKISLPRFLHSLKYIGLALIALVLVITKMPQFLSYRIGTLSFNQLFIVKMKVLTFGMLLAGITLSTFNYRFFCHNLCPLKAVSAIVDKVKKGIN